MWMSYIILKSICSLSRKQKEKKTKKKKVVQCTAIKAYPQQMASGLMTDRFSDFRKLEFSFTELSFAVDFYTYKALDLVAGACKSRTLL